MFIITFVGPQACGKTTLATSLALELENTLHISQDKVRYALLDYPNSHINFFKPLEKLIDKITLTAIKKLSKKHNIIYDEICFLHRLKPILKLKKKTFIIIFRKNTKLCLYRNKHRLFGNVPEHAIRRDIKRIEKETPKILKLADKYNATTIFIRPDFDNYDIKKIIKIIKNV